MSMPDNKKTLPKEHVSPSPETPEQKIGRLSNALGIDKIKESITEQAKMLDNVIRELGNTNASVSRIAVYLEAQHSGQIPTTTIGTATQSPPLLSQEPIQNMIQDPVMKAELISKLAEALSSIINAVKGNNTQASPSPFATLGEQMVTDLIRATVDDVQQRVYNIRKLPPPNVRAIHGPE